MTNHLTTRQLAERWGISPGTLSNWRGQGKGPAYIRIGRKAVYVLTDVERYEAERVFSSTAAELCGPMGRVTSMLPAPEPETC